MGIIFSGLGLAYDSLGRMVENIEASTSRVENSELHTWRYAYSQAGDLVGTSDARGCGTNYYYDSSGRLTIEDYAPCEAHQAAFTPFVPEVLYTYDSFVGDPDASQFTGGCHTKGRLVSVVDRGGKAMTCFDTLGRTVDVARQLAGPSSEVDGHWVPGALGGRWYRRTAEYDTADRPVLETTGGSVGGSSFVSTTYTKRGTVGTVGSSYGDLVTQVKRDADGMAQEIVYGDAAATTTGFMYDELRRLRNLTTYRGKPQKWTQTGTHTQQLLLQDEQYTYDRVGNPTEIRDWRIASEWDAGAKPVTRKLKYDDLYRLSKIEYQYPQGSDEWKDPFAAEVSDINRPQPSPRADFTGAKRPLWQTYAYDWLGNTVSTDDDAHAFYDRSLGTVANTGYQLTGADNASKGGSRTGNLTSEYDASGNLITMALHRQGPCVPANKCTNQHFDYEWDEVGRLVRARRFDMANPPSGTPPDAELSYTYDASDNRVLKTVGNHYTAYIFGSLELRSITFEGDYVIGPTTETVYLQAHGVRLARVVHEVDDPYELAATRVFLELGDQLGSTSVVLDLASGELVEQSTAYAYGATESDYRPERWGKFREDYRFTGKEEDIEVGLQYFGKRFYAPLLQRWVSADPLAVHAPGQADLSVYAYVHGRVLVAVDPVGLDLIPGGAGAGQFGGEIREYTPADGVAARRHFKVSVSSASVGAYNEVASAVRQAVAGDFNQDEPTLAGGVASIGVGLIPYAGLVADARDIAANADRVSRGEPGAWYDLTFSVAGIAPVVGDGGKIAYKMIKRLLTAQALLSSVAKNSPALAKSISRQISQASGAIDAIKRASAIHPVVGDLMGTAFQVHAKLHPVAQQQRTTAVMLAMDGNRRVTIVAGSSGGLSSDQIAEARKAGIHFVDGGGTLTMQRLSYWTTHRSRDGIPLQWCRQEPGVKTAPVNWLRPVRTYLRYQRLRLQGLHTMSQDPFEHTRWLENALSAIPPEARAAFAAACVQRVVPVYRVFAEAHGVGDPEEFQALVDLMWSSIRTPLGAADTALADAMDRAEALYEEGQERATFAGHGDNVVVSLCAALDSLSGTTDAPRQAADEVSTILKNYVLSNSVSGAVGPDEIEAAMRHPLCEAERERQRRDLDSLAKAESLNNLQPFRRRAEEDGLVFFGEGWLDEVEED